MDAHHPGTMSYERLLSPRPPVSADIKPRNYRGMISSPYAVSTHINREDTMKSSTSNLSNSRRLQSIISPVKHVELDSYSYDSGLDALTTGGTLTQEDLRLVPGRAVKQKNLVNAGTSQLAVRHTSSKGTQEGLLFPKYQLDSTSKCIMCKDCGIFFSHDTFLHHLHDVYGKRVECYGQFLELAIDAPNLEQLQLFQDFLSKMGMTRDRVLNNTGSQHRSVSPGKHGSNLVSPSRLRASSPVANTWTKGIQDTVLASEKLLKETSDYLKSSAKKMKHRRQNSFQYQGLPPVLSKKEDNPSETLPVNTAVPIIKTHNSHRTSKKSLQKYFNVNPNLPMRPDNPQPQPLLTHTSSQFPKTVRTQQDSVASKDDVNAPKYSSLRQQSDDVLKNHWTPHHQDTVTSLQDINSPNLKQIPMSSQHPVEDDQLAASLHIEALNSTKPSGFGDDEANSKGMDGRGDYGGISVKDLLTSKVEQVPRLGQDKKDDPVYILQTAQDLITLAAHKIEQQPSHDNTTDWFSKYKAEHALRLRGEAQIQELQGMLKDEQRKRRELEVQLRAMRLQTV